MVAVALACAAAVSATIIPAAHAFDTGQDVVGAWYTQGGLIKVLAREAVDPFSIDPFKISLDACTRTGCIRPPLAGLAVVRDAGDERVVLMLLPPAARDAVLASQRATLTLEHGAFRHSPDGDAVRESVVRVAMPGNHVAELLVRAEYDSDTDLLSLNFADAVDISRADWDGVHLRDSRGGADGLAFRPFLGLDPAGADGRTFVFGFDAQKRDILRDMERPTLYMGNGTDRWIGITVPGKSVWFREMGLGSAEYLADENRLHLRFFDEVNPYLVYPFRVYIYNSVVNFFEEIRGLGFVGVSEDRRTVILDLPESARYGLSIMGDPNILIDADAVGVADGTAYFDPQTFKLEVTGADFFPPNPDIPAGVPVERAVHREETGELTLWFVEAIEPSSINASRITIAESNPCVEMNLSGTELAGVAGDGRSAVFALDRPRSDALYSMGDDARIFMGRGTFLAGDGGTPNEAFDVPLSHVGQSPKKDRLEFSTEARMTWVPCHLTYRVDPSLGELLAHYGYEHPKYQRMVLAAIHSGLDVWSRLNPHITFERITDGDPSFRIEWRYANSTFSAYSFGGLSKRTDDPEHIPGFAMPPVLGLDDGALNKLAHPHAIMAVVSHEFGHNLGLGHHASYMHLMHGIAWQDPYDDLGLNIPEDHWYVSDPRWQGVLVTNPPLDIPDHGWWWGYDG